MSQAGVDKVDLIGATNVCARSQPKERGRGKRVASRIAHTRELESCGYCLTIEHLRRIDLAFRQSALFDDSAQPVHYTGYTADGRALEFDSLDDLDHHANIDSDTLTALSVYRSRQDLSVGLNFDQRGRIELEMHGNRRDLEKLGHAVGQQARTARRDVSRMVQWLILRSEVQALAAVTALIGTVAIATLCVLFLQSLREPGVVVEQSLRLSEEQYLRLVADAFKTSDVSTKLNAVLASNFRGVVDRGEQVALLKSRLSISGMLTLGSILYIFLVRKVRPLYPASFIALGAQVGTLERMQRHRDFWLAGIVLGAFVNIACSFVFAWII